MSVGVAADSTKGGWRYKEPGCIARRGRIRVSRAKATALLEAIGGEKELRLWSHHSRYTHRFKRTCIVEYQN